MLFLHWALMSRGRRALFLMSLTMFVAPHLHLPSKLPSVGAEVILPHLIVFSFFAVVSHVSFVTSNSKLGLDCWQRVMFADNRECFEHLFLASLFFF